MADQYIVTDSGRYARDGQPELWYVTYQLPDGTVRNHFFPPEAFAWRAAEYGFDDPAEILDVILHELLVPPETAPAPQSFTASHAHRRPAAPGADLPTLFQCTSTVQARDAHRQRITAVKETIATITAPADQPSLLGGLVAAVSLDAGDVLAKMQLVDVYRWEAVYGALPVLAEESSYA